MPTAASETIQDWRDLQDKVARLFRNLGCRAKVDAIVHGVRAAHRIDALVIAPFAGSSHRILVECKYWNRNVGKAQAATFKAIVEDLGGEKGMIVSRRGFQRGAFSITRRTNIELLTWEQLRSRAASEIMALKRRKCIDVLIQMQQKLGTHASLMQERAERAGTFWYGTDEFMSFMGRASMLKTKIESLDTMQFPRYFVWASPGGEEVRHSCNTKSEYLDRSIQELRRLQKSMQLQRERIFLDEYPDSESR
jgi:hypothetical protein